MSQAQINNTITTVFKSIQDMINRMDTGDRKPTKETVAQVSEETGISLGITNGLVSLFTENSRDAIKSAGRTGGIKKQEIDNPSVIGNCEHCGAATISIQEKEIVHN